MKSIGLLILHVICLSSMLDKRGPSHKSFVRICTNPVQIKVKWGYIGSSHGVFDATS